MQLGLAEEAGTGRDEAIPAGTRVHTTLRKNLMFKVVLAAKTSLRIMNCVEILVLARTSEKHREHLLTAELRC